MAEQAPKKPVGKLGFVFKNADLLLTFFLFGVVLLLIVPIQPIMLDLLLTLSIGMALLILLVIIYLKDPIEFSVFPTVLLGITLFRLGLNVASTRLILDPQAQSTDKAGQIIETFGSLVIGDNYVVGAVVFFILVIINFVVITKGAGRIAEVAARFTLDAMPGKQMAIDAEMNAGIIDERQATHRRAKIQKEADFYGSMDGASKFVRGDAVAGLLITLINVVGGITVGVFFGGLDLGEALKAYTQLSIGDGLVSQIPALIVSVAAGILVTRSAEGSNLSEHLGSQLIVNPRAFAIVGAMLFFFAITIMPTLPFLTLSAVCFGIAFFLHKKAPELTGADERGSAIALPGGGTAKVLPDSGGTQLVTDGGRDALDENPIERANRDMQQMIYVDTFAVELGYGLIQLADKNQNGDLLERITGLRQKIARDLGIIIPPVAVRDNLEMENNDYRFLLRNKEVSRGTIFPNRWMAMNVSGSSAKLKGVPTVEPVYQLEAVWIPEDERKNAEMNGFTVIDPSSVLITHLSEMLKDVANLVLEREDVQKLVDLVKERNPTLINELFPDLVSIGVVQRVLQNLLKEKVSIKNFTIILETIADFASFTKNPDELAEQVRKRLGVYFVPEYENEPGVLRAMTLDPRLEQLLVSRVKRTQFDVGLMMDPQLTEHLLNELNPLVSQVMDEGTDPVIITTAELRLAFKRFFEPSFPRLAVLAYQEIPNETQIQNIGVVNMPPDNSLQQKPNPQGAAQN